MVTVVEPGTQGEVVAGTQGTGVSTPMAAAVALITAGLVGDLQSPNETMLTWGAKSSVVAASLWSMVTACPGRICRGEGVVPIEH